MGSFTVPHPRYQPVRGNHALVTVQLTSSSAATAGAVVFRAGITGTFSNSLTVQVPISGNALTFFVAGRNGRPSVNDGDVTIEARTGTTLVGSVKLMVRIRKNANNLTAGERDRLVAAFAQLNNQGTGRFADFRDMHTFVSSPQAHFMPGFLPWHRAYLLDLERELQAIDRSVALPYWRFDRPAPNIFTRDFFGVSNAMGTVQFSPTNPLQFWRTDGVPGITRLPLFNTSAAPLGLLNEAQTLALGGPSAQYRNFRIMEANPHGLGAYELRLVSTISSIDTAAKDPLFFLLHCNVDRLWAKWQRQFSRFNRADAASYDSNPLNPPGHNLPDTMWPWNGVTGGTRPPTAPGGAMASSPIATATRSAAARAELPRLPGKFGGGDRMGFDYDDVPFA